MTVRTSLRKEGGIVWQLKHKLQRVLQWKPKWQRLPILVHLQNGRSAEIGTVNRSPTNRHFVYVHFGPDLKPQRETGKSLYTKPDLISLIDTACKVAYWYYWPREWRFLVVTIPLALILLYLGIWFYHPLSLLLLAFFPPALKKRRRRLTKNAKGFMPRDILRLFDETQSPVAERLMENGIWVAYNAVIVSRPSFWK